MEQSEDQISKVDKNKAEYNKVQQTKSKNYKSKNYKPKNSKLKKQNCPLIKPNESKPIKKQKTNKKQRKARNNG